MVAKIKKENEMHTAIYERTLNHNIDKVWMYLTENKKLQQWFSELEIQELKYNREILFDFGDGSYKKMYITAVIPKKVFAFTWDKNAVQFKLNAKDSGCQLVFKEYLITHTNRFSWRACPFGRNGSVTRWSID